MPPRLRGDFQDIPAWRQGVYEVLDRALTECDGTVIAPMTVIEPKYLPVFAEHLWTDQLTIPQVADQIATSASLTLTPNTDCALRGRLRRAWTEARHIRFG